MASKFALILAILTLVTGIFWCFEKLKRRSPGRAKNLSETSGERGKDPLDDSKGGTSKNKAAAGFREGIASLFPVLAIVLVIRSFVYEPFQIPSGSMMPTLLIGDFILVEKYAYGLKDPITQRTLVKTGQPKRGDIAVFRYPKEPSIDYIKRVIGLPGDRIVYDPIAKILAITPNCHADTACAQSASVTYTDIQPSDFVQTFNSTGDTEPSNGFYRMAPEETLPNGLRLVTRKEKIGTVDHDILMIAQATGQDRNYYRQSGEPASTWVVPEGHYFMMGDNRDNSADSRYWGFVPEGYLVGKATAIWMSFEKQQGEWPTGVRLNRIGSIH